MTGVLLSIKPKYVQAILEGTKHYEFRKKIFNDSNSKTVYIYSSSPMKKIVACFHPGKIVQGSPDFLWEQFREFSGLSESEFFNYFSGKETGYAIPIDELETFEEPINPYNTFERFVPPQSFCYVDSPSIVQSTNELK
ncbi:conserved hypothetical protein [Methanoregula boonei 6A8]|uniref:ASCH domain-containing protein n=2 Tax=Methanoregula TaxID=395331 RepID=A7IAQ0_METB6|nr:conserved hypothetical protein [Methanoregula boonei 6A8]